MALSYIAKKGCFDHLNHGYMEEQTKTFPAKNVISKWLKIGYVDNGVFHPTESGTPQGSIVSPLLANIALHGMEEEIGIRYQSYKDHRMGVIKHVTQRNCTKAMVRYADDFIILCKTKEEAGNMYEELKSYLTRRGLELAQDKTKVVHITDGFDFLGFHIRQYNTQLGKKLFIKPSKASIKKAKEKIKEVFTALRGQSVGALIAKLNPIIRGYANYWMHVVSKKIFTSLDFYIWSKIVKYLHSLHPKKSWKWKVKQYFAKAKHGGNDRWVLTCPITGNQIYKMSWTPIIRHVCVKYKNSPDDPTLQEYYEERNKKEFNHNHTTFRIKLAKKQRYRCTLCSMPLQNGEGLEVHHKTPKKSGGTNELKNLSLVHISCHIQYHQQKPKKKRETSVVTFEEFLRWD